MSPTAENLRRMGEVLRKSGARQCYYYPGMQGDAMAQAVCPTAASSLNERNAFEFGYGASLAGGRTVVVFKGVGLATCLDSVQHAVINGVGAGLVVVILEDTVAASSPEIIDSRPMMDYARTLMVEPHSVGSALSHLASSFEVSERLDAPVFFRLTHELLSSSFSGEVPAVSRTEPPKISFGNYRSKSIKAWGQRVEGYEAKQAAIQTYVDSLYEAAPPAGKTSITFGCAQAAGDTLLVEHYPVPAVVRDFYKTNQPQVDELGSNYGERLLASAPVTFHPTTIVGQSFPESRVWEDALAKIDKAHYGLVVADEGRYTSDSTGLVDCCLCMGSSIAVCAGASLQMGTRNLALVGDFAYLFNAYPAIVEAAARQAQIDVVVLDDGKASSTGGQAPVAPVRTEDVRAHVSELATYEYDKLPATLMGKEAAGVRLCRVVKND